MRIRIDTRQQAHKHDVKDAWFAAHNVEMVRQKIDFGDYTLDTDTPAVSVDTKRNINEIAQNISAGHERLKREIMRAKDAGARLVFLIENKEGYLTVGDLLPWINTECKRCKEYRTKNCDPTAKGVCMSDRHKSKRKPIQGVRLATAMHTMTQRYGVEWIFCKPEEAAQIIYNILQIEEVTSEQHN